MDIRLMIGPKLFRLTTAILFCGLLVSCGGSGSSSGDTAGKFSVGGTVSGLLDSVTLRNNATNVLTVRKNGSFVFNTLLNTGDSYSVVVHTQPVDQVCTVSNASGVIANADVTDVTVSCGSGVNLSGSYQAVPLIRIDSDVNDATAAPNVDNGSFTVAQPIQNFSTVHGFATLNGTGRILEGDRFASSADAFDVYRVNLQKDQSLRLQVVDFSGVDVFTGDLDLYLYDDTFTQIDSSVTTTEFENITVPADGEYYITVAAFSGSSKYTLNLNLVAPLNSTQQNSTDFIPGEAVIQFKTGVAISNFKANSLVVDNEPMRLSHVQTTRAALASFNIEDTSVAAVTSQSKTKPGFIDELKQNNFLSYQKYKTLQKIKRLQQRADIAYAEPNYIYHATSVPTDPFYKLQWNYPAINLPLAWDITTGSRAGSSVIVAVVDTGVFLAHPEFAGQLVNGYDFISASSNAADGGGIDSNPDDPGDSAQLNNSSWHGTHVSGTIAAKTNNNVGVAGVAWQAKIMPIRALGTQGGSNYDIIQSIRFAAGLSNDSLTVPAQKADIINLSLGGTGYSQAAQDAYNAVRAAGVIVVAAAGNENTSQLSYPASYDGVVSVSATDFADKRAPYSNFGTQVDVAAPGGNQSADLNNDGYGDGVLSALVDDSSGTRQPTYKFYQGTSMATPHVAGVFALMRAVYPAITPAQIDSLLSSGAITTDLGAAGRDDIFGNGLIDALKAVQMAQLLANGGTPPPLPARIVATPRQLVLGANSDATLLLSNAGDDPASITSVTVDAVWLNVVEGTVDADKLGDYRVSIDRTGLSDSSYIGQITFNLSTGSTLSVPVRMDVGVVADIGDVGSIYVLLLDLNNDFVDQATVFDTGNGSFDYSFSKVAPGNYRIVGGSDIDNDLFICQLAEACGGYPVLNDLSVIEVLDSDIAGLDFTVDIQANFGLSSASTDVTKAAVRFQRTPADVTRTRQLPR